MAETGNLEGAGEPAQEEEEFPPSHPPKLMALVLSWILGGMLLLGLWMAVEYRETGIRPAVADLVRLGALPSFLVCVGCGLYMKISALRDNLMILALLTLFVCLTWLAAMVLRYIVTGALAPAWPEFDPQPYIRPLMLAIACWIHLWILIDDDVVEAMQ